MTLELRITIFFSINEEVILDLRAANINFCSRMIKY